MAPAIARFEALSRPNVSPRQSISSEAAPAEERPEIQLNLRADVWASFQGGFVGGPTPPYWALAWPGGQALARYILDHPEIVAGRDVVDWGAGSGLAAIAAAIAGARLVRAIDRDPRSIEAIYENARLNGVSNRVVAVKAELPSSAHKDGEVILAADLWYDRFDANRITAGLRSLARRGATVLLADTERAFTPRRNLKVLSRYSIITDPGIEQTRLTRVHVALLEGAMEAI
jgi:predicted nicotinamide N-methyase